MSLHACLRGGRWLGGRVGPPILAALLLAVSISTSAQDATPGAGLSGAIVSDGSATLAPALRAAAEAFNEDAPDVEIAVEATSTGKGFARFCAGETDLATAGRRIKDEEATDCADAGIAYDAFAVAYDGIAIVANPANDFLDCATVAQLEQLWAPGSTVATWQELDPAWPAEPIALHARGTDSGTFQFFTQAIVGTEGESRSDYTVHDDHGAIADAVAAGEQALGVLPFPFYTENQDRLTLIGVDGGDGCVSPEPETIRDGSYAPLSRPMFLYAGRDTLARAEVAAFLTFTLADAAGFAEAGGLVAFPEEDNRANAEKLEAAIAGTADPDGPAAAGTPGA